MGLGVPRETTLGYLQKHRPLIIGASVLTLSLLVAAAIFVAGRPVAGNVIGWVSALGLIISLAGFFVSVGGFGLTISQLVETTKEVDAAVRESQRIRTFLVSYDAAQESSKAAYALSAAKKHLNNDAWQDTADSYEDFRRGLVSLSRNIEDLSDDTQKQIEEVHSYVTKLASRMDRYVNSGYDSKYQPDKTKIMTLMRSHGQLISDVDAIVQKRIFDVNNS